MTPLVTFAIPNYNGARYVGQTIESLLRQTHQDLKVIFVDDQSTDDSLAVAESFSDPRFSIVRSTQRVSMAGNWNRAASLVETPYFVLAHNDDVYEPEYLEVMLSLLERSPSAFIAHCKVRTIDEENRPVYIPGQEYKDALWPLEDPYERSVEDEIAWMRKGDIIIAPTVMYRTEMFREIGPFDERYGFVTDWQYWFRGLLAGHTIVGTHSRLVQWRRHDGTATKALETNLRRFREEIEVSTWIADEVRALSIPGDPRPDYDLVLNTMLSEFASRLARGEIEGARAIVDLAKNEIPSFAHSWRRALMRSGFSLGAFGGRLMKRAEVLYLWLLNARRRGHRANLGRVP